MKTFTLTLVLSCLMLGLSCGRKSAADPADLTPPPVPAAKSSQNAELVAESKATGQSGVPGPKGGRTYSSLDAPDPASDMESFPAGMIKFQETDLLEVLKVYQEMSGRTVIRASSLPAAKITIQTQTALNRREVLQALDTVLSQNGITMILLGTKFVKAVPSAQAPGEAVPVVELPPQQLPDSGSYMLYIVELKSLIPREVAPILQPFAKMPNSIVPIDSSGLLFLRDYSSNIRRMLEVLQRMERAQIPAPGK